MNNRYSALTTALHLAIEPDNTWYVRRYIQDKMAENMYTVILTNFGVVVYEGTDPEAAKAAAVRTGFDCNVRYPAGMKSWSPIGGWRTVYKEQNVQDCWE